MPGDMKQNNKKLKKDIRLVVGLGNPGNQYENSRHNAGFRVLDIISAKYRLDTAEYRFSSLLKYKAIEEKYIIFAKPLTYMNRSGLAVGSMVARYNLDLNNILVILDDIALEQGRLRIRPRGSSGGHNGLKSIIETLKTEEIPRLRVGVGMPDPGWDVTTHVLSKFNKKEIPVIDEALGRAANAVSVWIEYGIDKVMNEFNC